MRVISFKATEDLDELIEIYAKKRKISKSELIRRAIIYYITKDHDQPYITRRIRVY